MTSEQNRVVEALQNAIQMEINGKEYYLELSQQSGKPGEKLLRSLAAEEDNHRQTFVKIYDTIKSKRDWPDVHFQPDGGRRLRTIFMKAMEEARTAAKAPSSELEAVEKAMDMENKTFDFYVNQSKQATYKYEKELYETIAGEEQEHHLILLDYFEYLKNPAGWFVKKEHPSIDGG